ncbi:class I SAM-dependent methyltransferase [Sphingomonas crocodyli]|nr:class I SAM-dependent methyltransferase [Sphingomonas crocodyli]
MTAITLREMTAAAYDAYSFAFLDQVDGEPRDPLGLDHRPGLLDAEIWARLDGEMVAMRAAGRDHIRILDAGCGPGLWLLRIARRARQLGFASVECRGFDIAPEMIVHATRHALDISDDHIRLHFVTGDIVTALDDLPDRAFDITLCLYSVLNHVPREMLADVAAHLGRVTRHALLLTVRAADDHPTIYVQPIGRARAMRQDDPGDRIDIVMADGRHLALVSHRFAEGELRDLFRSPLAIAETAPLSSHLLMLAVAR